ncbi:MAG: hypothetical protein K2G88_09245 [Oscillospiraceae bacterium]|nr:hypothetical protein [Oscillospiraceae bacterium]
MKKIKNIQKEKLIYSKPKYIILIILNIILLFFLTVILLTCMTFRYYIKSSEIPKALGKIILEEIKIEQDDGSKKSIAEYMLEEFSHDDRVSQEEIQEILEDGTFSDYIILAVEQYNHYLADGGELPELDTNNLKYPIKLLNKKLESVMYKYMYKSKTGFFLRIAVSIWIEIILAILMLLLLAWLIIIQVYTSDAADR